MEEGSDSDPLNSSSSEGEYNVYIILFVSIPYVLY